MAALGWLLNLGFAGSEAGVQPPTIAGPEFTVPLSRMHFTMPDSRMHHEVPLSRVHFTLPTEEPGE